MERINLTNSGAGSDEAWRDISARSPKFANHKASIVEMEVKGLMLPKFLAGFSSMADFSDLALIYEANPEHMAANSETVVFANY